MEDKRKRSARGPAPYSARARQALKKTAFGKPDEVIKRLIETCERLDREKEDLEVALAEAQQQSAKQGVDQGKAEQAFAGREKVLVIVDWDGFVEVYVEPWVDVRAVALVPGQDKDEAVAGLPQIYHDLYWPVKLKTTALPKYLSPPNQPRTRSDVEECLRRAVRYRDADALIAVVDEYREFRDSIARERREAEQRSLEAAAVKLEAELTQEGSAQS